MLDILKRRLCHVLPLYSTAALSTPRPMAFSTIRSNRIITTLHPDHLQPSEFLDLSNVKGCRVYLPTTSLPPTHIYYDTFAYRPRFPENSHGFLYCHSDPGSPADLWSVRFRLTSSNDPSTFSAGTDLLRTYDWLPWSVPVMSVALRRTCIGFRQLLTQDGLVSPEQWTEMQKFGETRSSRSPRRSFFDGRALRSLDQPFPLDLSTSYVSLYLGRDEFSPFVLRNVYRDLRPDVNAQPYVGQILVRFERSNFPEHQTKSHLLLRIVDILTPIRCAIPDYDGDVAMPVVGDLVTKANKPFSKKVGSALGEVLESLPLSLS